MSAHVYQSPNSGEAQVWIARCYNHFYPLTPWSGPDRPHTDKGLALAFADRDKHNRVEHPEDV